MMSKSLRFTWLAGWTLGVVLLGACVGVEEEESSQADIDQVVDEAQDPAAGDVAVELSANAPIFREGERVTVSVSFTNVAKHPVRLLSWQTGKDELEEDLFEITRDGEPVEYIGPHYKRPAPEKADYVTVAPGKTLTQSVELSNFYDLSKTGDYDIRYAVEVKETGKQGAALESGKVAAWIEGRESTTEKVEPSGGGLAGITSSLAFSKCTVTQQATVTDGLNAASAMADGASNYLAGTPSGTPRYVTWFGAYSSGGWNTAKTHFTAIKGAIDSKPLTFDCGCKKTYYAYVYPNSPYVVYLCKAFWSAPLTGTDSKGGTIIHELSHFTAVAGTDDHVYGQSGAKSLAISSPSQALSNADNHEYFAENTPSLQ